MAKSLAKQLRKKCPLRLKKGQSDPLVYLNANYIKGSAYKFSSSYYQGVLDHKGVLGVDQQLLTGEDTKQITEEFAAGFEDFRKSFALSMSRMGNINVLTGNQGEIRRNCRFTNK